MQHLFQDNIKKRYYDADHPREARRNCVHRCVSPHMIPRARETSCCILLTLFASYLSTNQSHVCFHDRAIFCSTNYASDNPTLGAMPSLMADHIGVESSDYHFPQLYLNYQVDSNFCFVWRECLGLQVLIVLTVLSFRFSGLCLMVVNATIHFHGQASPVGVWSFLRLPPNPSSGKKKPFKSRYGSYYYP